MLLDTQSGTQARAAIAVGDPDKATHVSVTTPGLNTTVHGGIESMAEEATNVRREALRQLRFDPGHESDTVSTIAWIGYDPRRFPASTTRPHRWPDSGESPTTTSPAPARTIWLASTTGSRPRTWAGPPT